MFHIYLWLFLLTLFALFAWAYSVKHIERTKALEQLKEDRQKYEKAVEIHARYSAAYPSITAWRHIYQATEGEKDPRCMTKDHFQKMLNRCNFNLNRALDEDKANCPISAGGHLDAYERQVKYLITLL